VFGSDEYAEFVGSSFIDAFGIYLNGTNIATFAGDPVNIDHPNMAFIGGTELDGILDPTSGSGDPIMLFQGLVTPGSTGNTLTFIIADSGDSQLDSTVYIEGLGTENPGGGTQVPEPGAMTVFGLGLLGLAWARRPKSVRSARKTHNKRRRLSGRRFRFPYSDRQSVGTRHEMSACSFDETSTTTPFGSRYLRSNSGPWPIFLIWP
jgi:hypothetical protein